MPIDVNALMARAEAAFRNRRFDAARTDLATVTRAVGDHPAVLHLLALVEQQAGRAAASRTAFERALRLASDDPQINNNFANLLGDTGDTTGALRHYDRALLRQPDFVDARVNRALLHERAGRFAPGKADALRAVALAPRNAAACTVLGSISRALGELDEAAAAFDAALALQPERTLALHGRARVALERGEPDAVSLYRRVLASNGMNHDAILGFASALNAEGDPQGEAVLTQAVTEHPGWIEGHRELVRMRCENGRRDAAATAFETAVEAHPQDTALRTAYWQTLTQLDRHGEVLAAIAADRGRFATDPTTAIIEAACADEVGDTAAASRMFAALSDSNPAAIIPHVRHLLRLGSLDQAATILEARVRADPHDIVAWAHIELVWRLVGDNRHHWLAGQPGLVGTTQIDLDASKLGELAATLRTLHTTRAHPIEQSVRGGTQTRGALFARTEPILRTVRDVLNAAVAAHFAALPPVDPAHPLLRHRNEPMTITGSWSVRLEGGGFHISHVHPQGLLSSALYVAIPETRDDRDRAGWLELGVAPPELALQVSPLAAIAPKPGLLALFPSYLFHGTRPFGSGERLTVAFDIAARR